MLFKIRLKCKKFIFKILFFLFFSLLCCLYFYKHNHCSSIPYKIIKYGSNINPERNSIQANLKYEALDNTSQILCDVVPLGCYKIVRNFNQFAFTSSNDEMNITWCLKTCSDGGGRYAGLANGNKCFCSREGVNVIANMRMESNNCNTSCLGNNLEHCGEPQEAQLYRLKSTCLNSRNLPSEFETTRFRGYAEILPAETVSNFRSPKDCILFCNKKDEFALWNTKLSTCICKNTHQKIVHRMISEICPSNLFAVYRTFVDSNRCKPMRFLPSDSKIKTIVLASIPGSGNTWVRHLIQQASGIYTGSIYFDKRLYNEGFLGESHLQFDKEIFVVKDHLWKLNTTSFYDGAVLIIRSPYRSAIAAFNLRMTKNHVENINKSEFYSEEFRFYMMERFSFQRVPNEVMNGKIPFHLLIFENLLVDPIGELRKVMDFLYQVSGFKQNDLEKRLECLSENIDGSNKRKFRSLPKNPFTKEMLQKVEREVAVVRSRLLQLNKNFVFPNYQLEF